MECRHKFSISTVNSIFLKWGGGEEIESLQRKLDSTQPRLDFESKEDMDSLYFPLCARLGLQIKSAMHVNLPGRVYEVVQFDVP